MSFKEIREFVDSMKELECPDFVDIDSFQYPDFPLTAKLLYWLVSRCDPSFQIPFEIEAEQDRVYFLKALTDNMRHRYNIVLDPKKLYMADGYSVRELLKISRLLRNYPSVWNSVQAGNDVSVIDEDIKDKLLAKVMDLRMFRKDQGTLASTSAEIFNMLKDEPENHSTRISALNMKLDPSRVETTLTSLVAETELLADEYQQKFENIEFDKTNLEGKIKKREEELERMQRRFQAMQGTKPSHLDETDKLEAELKEIYERYCKKYILMMGLEDQVEKMERQLEEKENAARSKDMSDIQRVDDLALMGLDSVIIDDGFNEDPVDHSDTEPEPRAPARMRALNVREDAIDRADLLSDEEPKSSAARTGRISADALPGSSDDEF